MLQCLPAINDSDKLVFVDNVDIENANNGTC